ncbi:hypothetical protein TB2_003523 [Malus domestica]|uniref:Bromo domain-containing protein n=1 Tax=Malus domestica TaxID=3750 RepID=A0A498J0A1_MALDO|nr:hypothetical protein DVH24_034684 [Malus domestica]
MGKVVERKKKKKGRPSLLDLQKRTLREQQEQLQHQHQKRKPNSAPHSNPNYRTAPTESSHASLRRSTRRNPNPDGNSNDEDEDEDEDDDVSAGNRREKKLKLVLKLPFSNQKQSANSASRNSPSVGSESNADDDGKDRTDRKRKINAIGYGSGLAHPQKGEKSIPAANPPSSLRGGLTTLDSGPSTPLPDKNLLLFVLDRLQKKDTYGVFSEPVDPKELPDYHEVIEHPMDFGTVKKKLTSGVYSSLERFEDDIFLICSNAMQYNAPDTIYFRQARSIHELAKKNFENLRQDSDDNEPGPKVVRRGRPPTKNLHKKLGRPSLDRAGSEVSDAALATGAESTTLDLRKGSLLSDKSGLVGSRNNDVYINWLTDNKFERNDDVTGSTRGNSKLGKKQFVFDENRRNTYNQTHPSASGRESSVLTTFDGERKQLMAVGLHSDYGYARSLARFAANLGAPAWTIAAKKIERPLLPGVKFGPGWVGENDVASHRPLLLASASLCQPSSSEPFPIRPNASSAAAYCSVESNGDKLSEKLSGHHSSEKPSGYNSSEKHVPSIPLALDSNTSSSLPLSAATLSPPIVANKSPEPLPGKVETAEGSNTCTGFNMPSSNLGVMRPRPPFQIHQNSIFQPGINGFNGTNGLNIPAHMRKLVGAAGPGGFNFQLSQMLDAVSRTNVNFHPATSNSLTSEETKLSETSGNGSTDKGDSSPAILARVVTTTETRFRVVTPIKIRFSSTRAEPQVSVPRAPSSSQPDSAQPDLTLQL